MTAIEPDERVLVSYLTLRKVVGTLGMLLPVIVATWGLALDNAAGLRNSISDYHQGPTGDAFVGILFTIGWFLFTYRGYDKRDEWTGNFAALFALLVALFPNTAPAPVCYIHFGAALALFLLLAYFSLGLFTKSGGAPTPRKLIRNRVYRFCGVIMLLCIALIGVHYAMGQPATAGGFKPVFWLESMALWAFGISWFVKGEAILKDKT